MPSDLRGHRGKMHLLRHVERHQLIHPQQQVGQSTVGPRSHPSRRRTVPREIDEPTDENPLFDARYLRQPLLELGAVDEDLVAERGEKLVEIGLLRVAAMKIDHPGRARRLQERANRHVGCGRGSVQQVESRRQFSKRTSRDSCRSHADAARACAASLPAGPESVGSAIRAPPRGPVAGDPATPGGPALPATHRRSARNGSRGPPPL